MKNNFLDGTAVFVMPHWITDNRKSKGHLDEAISSILDQTDINWKLVIVDDFSPCLEAREYLSHLEQKYPHKIKVIFNSENLGPGAARNTGIKWAYSNDFPIVLFNDADDISHQKRLETVRSEFVKDSDADVVYSTFNVIDENSKPVSDENISPCIYETLEGHKKNIVQGKNAWFVIGTEKNYTNLTSSTAVKTEVAYKFPFPIVKAAEDTHAWYRYGANGGKFIYCPQIPTLYRIPQNTACSTRARLKDFYDIKAATETSGFIRAMEIAISRGDFNAEERDSAMIKFYIKLAESVAKGEDFETASQQVLNARKISEETTKQVIKDKGLQNAIWTVF